MKAIYRVLYNNRGTWQIKELDSQDTLRNWLMGNAGAILIRFAVASSAGNLSFDTKEEAQKKADELNKENKREQYIVKPIKPRDSIFNQLPNEAVELFYTT